MRQGCFVLPGLLHGRSLHLLAPLGDVELLISRRVLAVASDKMQLEKSRRPGWDKCLCCDRDPRYLLMTPGFLFIAAFFSGIRWRHSAPRDELQLQLSPLIIERPEASLRQ